MPHRVGGLGAPTGVSNLQSERPGLARDVARPIGLQAQAPCKSSASKTTHVFTKTATGGTQTVTANDAADTTQIRLIRGHLREEAAKFSRGDFTDPGGHPRP
jgi:hypothetical protein